LDESGDLASLEHGGCAQQAARQNVHRADMSVEKIRGIDAWAADLGIEVVAARREDAARENVVQRERYFAQIVGKLIRVPTVLRVAAVHVDGAENTVVNRHGDFVLEAMAGERCMVRLDIDLDLLFQAMMI